MKLGFILQGGLAGLLFLVAVLCVGAVQRFYPANIPFLNEYDNHRRRRWRLCGSWLVRMVLLRGQPNRP